MSITNSLGRVMPVDKGAYNEATNYDRLDMVHTADSTYVSLVDDNVGNPVTDTTKWQCYADGKPATEAATAATAAAGNATAAAAAANAAAGRAPYIGENGNWFVWSVQQNQYVDSGVDASAPELTIDPDYTIRKDGEVFTEAIKDANEQAQADHAQYLIDHASIASKANVAANAVAGHMATLDANGNPTESGLDADDIALKDGYYQQLVAGNAENMIDTKGQGTEQEFTRRTSCGDQSIADDGAAIFKSIRGKSLVWNQSVNSKLNGWSASGFDMVTGTDSITFTRQEGYASSLVIRQGGLNLPIVQGHKYLLYFVCRPSSSFLTSFNCYDSSFHSFLDGSMTVGTNGYKGILTASRTGNADRLTWSPKQSSAADLSIVVKNHLFIDLTLMFGAGNEPSTVAEFEAMYNAAYYAYNAGKIINNAVEHYITDGFNQWDEGDVAAGTFNPYGDIITSGDYATKSIHCISYIPCFQQNYFLYCKNSSMSVWYVAEYDGEKRCIGRQTIAASSGLYTPSRDARFFRWSTERSYGTTTYQNDICVNLSWSGYRNGEYEPYWKRDTAFALLTATGKKNGEGSSAVVAPEGARSAGNAFDEWVIENGYITKFIKRLGKYVVTGNETWAAWGDYAYYASNNVISSLPCVNDSAKANGITSKLNVVSTSDLYAGRKTSGFGVNGNTVYISASDYANIASLTGMEVVYILATPEEYILDEPIFIGAPKVADFGTETAKECLEVDANGVPKSAPFRAAIKYSTDYPREIANLPKAYDTIAGLDDLCTALASALGGALNGTLAITRGAYDSVNQKYAWTVTFTPNEQGE